MKTRTRRIQDRDNYNVSVLFQRGGRDRTYVGRHGILALRMTATRLSEMANINGNIYLKPCEGFKEELLTK